MTDIKGSLTIVRSYVGTGGVQIILEHQSTSDLLEACKLGEVVEIDGAKTFRPISLGKERALLLTVKTPKGKEGQLVWGDTHALHASHQVDKEFFSLLLGAAQTNAFEIAVTGFEVKSIKKGKKGASKLPLNKDAC